MDIAITKERRAALLMLRKHGPIATTRALKLAQERSQQGDMAGWSLWYRVSKAIDQLRHTSGCPLPSR